MHMQCEGGEESEEMSPDMCESAPCGHTVWFLMWAYNNTRSAVAGCPPHCLVRGEWPGLLIDLLFPMICANTRLRRVPPMLRRCKKASTEDAPKPNANSTMKGTDKGEIMIYLQAQSNWCWETWFGQRLTCFKEKGRWNTDGMEWNTK